LNRKNFNENIDCIYSSEADTGLLEEEKLIQHSTLPIREILQRLNAMLAKTRCEEARHYLQMWQRCARGKHDWGSELVLCSELLCLLRHMKDKDAALAAVCRCQELLRNSGLENTVQGAPYLMRIGAVLDVYGKSDQAMQYFRRALDIYSTNLEKPDERVAQTFNNIAVTAASMGQTEKAEEYFRRAIQILRQSAFSECASAVTYCNMAIVYGRKDPEDPRIGDCLELAWNQLSVPDIPKDHCYAQALDQCLPVFDHFGYFLYTMNLKDRLRDVSWT
jgi:tetratricopeptide (TPR) repeat protein